MKKMASGEQIYFLDDFAEKGFIGVSSALFIAGLVIEAFFDLDFIDPVFPLLGLITWLGGLLLCIGWAWQSKNKLALLAPVLHISNYFFFYDTEAIDASLLSGLPIGIRALQLPLYGIILPLFPILFFHNWVKLIESEKAKRKDI